MPRLTRGSRQPDLDPARAIIETAWRQIAQAGAAGLSLRAIARELRITAPAIYNYYPRRDDLVTALVIQALTSFGDSQLAAAAEISAEDLPGRFHAIGLAYRRWAIGHPQRYELIFGAPIQGYQQPLECVLPVRARSISALVAVLEQARLAGRLQPEDLPQPAAEDSDLLAGWSDPSEPASPVCLSAAVLVWARVHGLVSLEIGGHLPPYGPTGDTLYTYELEAINRQFITQ